MKKIIKSLIFQRIFIFAILILLSVGLAFGGDSVPGWLSSAASGGVPTYEKDVPAVVLLSEQSTTLGSDGRLVTTENYAVKILTRDGRGYAVARAFYLASASKVRDLDAWLIRPDGSAKAYDKKMVLDIIADDEDVYNEGRVKVLNATDDVDVGSIFAYTIVSEEMPLFYQDRWEFQGRLPAVRSRYSLNLPSGWTASSITFNSAEIKPQVNGSSYSWEMRNLSPIPPEPMSPSVMNLSPRIVVNYGIEGKTQAGVQAFATWADVSRWATAMHEPFVIVDDNVAGKARELTANAKTELDKIRMIGTFVQNLQYISIDIGVGHGNGYRPRSSSTVLSRGYGDCKDKANLMRAMLKSLKIDAYPVAIFSGDPTFVREQWPSPRQFNHCIIAIKILAETKASSVLDHPKLGRLLIFDATDAYTPVGELPNYLQGSMALIAAGDNGDIARMPISPPESDLLERTVEATLAADGQLTGKITETAIGQAFATFRRETREFTPAQYRKAIEGWLTRGATGAQLLDLKHKDDPDNRRFDLGVEFRTPQYAQSMQGRLLVFKPVVVGRRHGSILTDVKRLSPIEIDPSMVNETAVFTLPPGYSIDEMPDPLSLDAEFGKYTTSYAVNGEKLTFKRTLRMTRSIVPPEKYDSVRNFYLKIREAEQSPVVLIKK